MRSIPRPWQLLLVGLAGWIRRRQLDVIEYLREENRVLREQMGKRRWRFTDDQRRRLAAKAKGLGRRVLRELGTIVTPDTLLRWHRRLIAVKYLEHYHSERNHQGLGNRLIQPDRQRPAVGPIECRQRLGGMLSFYHRQAA